MQDTIRVDRDKYIGGSDIPIILGISPFRTRWELLREKALGELSDFNGNIYTEYGNTMEPEIREYTNSLVGREFVEDKIINDIFRYHADGYDRECNEVLEIKTTSGYDDKKKRIYLAQLLWGMMQYGAGTGYLAVYERPDDMNEDFDPLALSVEKINAADYEDFLVQITDAVGHFVEDIHKLAENENLTEADLLPGVVTNLAYQVEELERKLIDFKAIQEAHDDLKEQLRQAMIKANIKSWEAPNGTKVTLVLDGEDKEVYEFNKDRFADENADLYKKYLEKKIKKGRKGYVKITPKKEKADE